MPTKIKIERIAYGHRVVLKIYTGDIGGELQPVGAAALPTAHADALIAMLMLGTYHNIDGNEFEWEHVQGLDDLLRGPS